MYSYNHINRNYGLVQPKNVKFVIRTMRVKWNSFSVLIIDIIG